METKLFKLDKDAVYVIEVKQNKDSISVDSRIRFAQFIETLKKEGINILGVAFGEDEKFTKVSRLETKYYVDADKVTRYAFYHLLYDAIIESGKKHTKIMKHLMKHKWVLVKNKLFEIK